MDYAPNCVFPFCPVKHMYTCTYCVPFLKHVPFWNMFHFGIVCRSEKCTILKHISDWQCANFVIMVISKPSVKCKVLKHKTCAKRPNGQATTVVCLFFSYECRATSNTVSSKGILSALDMTKFAVPIWNIF